MRQIKSTHPYEVINWAPPLHLSPVPRTLSVWRISSYHFAGKSWHLTSTGNSQLYQLRSLYRVCRSVYLAFFIFHPKVPVPQWWVALSLDDNVWSERRLGDVWELQRLAKVCVECPVRLLDIEYPASLCFMLATSCKWSSYNHCDCQLHTARLNTIRLLRVNVYRI